MKKEFYPISLGFAKKAAEAMEASQPQTYVTDCSLSALQIQEVRGEKPKHPLTVLREAYGLQDER
jgi:Fe-S oxidoreductase